MKKARGNAKLNIETVAGYQEYIELAIIDAFGLLGHEIIPYCTEQLTDKHQYNRYKITLHDGSTLLIDPHLAIITIESEEYLLDKDEMLGALIFAYQIMLNKQDLKVWLTKRNSSTYLRISSDFMLMGAKSEIDDFIDNCSGHILSEILGDILGALTLFHKQRHLFSKLTINDVYDVLKFRQ